MKDKLNLLKALSGFQQEVPVIHKETEGYGYTYADLPTIFEVINPILKKHGLGFTQLLNENALTTVVYHIETGESIESNTSLISGVSLAKMNDFQVLGSQTTYLRRYSLSSILGIITDKDTDAQGEQVKNTNNLPWINEKDIPKVVEHAQQKGMSANDLRKYFKISKANFAKLESEL